MRYLNDEEINGLSERADEETRWVAGHLSSDEIEMIESWGQTITLEIDHVGKILFCHGTPQSDIDVFTKLTPDEKLLPVFEDVNVPVVVCGHTHMQFDRTIGDVRVVNAGSVGMPFGTTGAGWLLIDTEIKFKNTPYDLENAADQIRRSSFPHAAHFALNNVLNTPSGERALQMLTALEID